MYFCVCESEITEHILYCEHIYSVFSHSFRWSCFFWSFNLFHLWFYFWVMSEHIVYYEMLLLLPRPLTMLYKRWSSYFQQTNKQTERIGLHSKFQSASRTSSGLFLSVRELVAVSGYGGGANPFLRIWFQHAFIYEWIYISKCGLQALHNGPSKMPMQTKSRK